MDKVTHSSARRFLDGSLTTGPIEREGQSTHTTFNFSGYRTWVNREGEGLVTTPSGQLLSVNDVPLRRRGSVNSAGVVISWVNRIV